MQIIAHRGASGEYPENSLLAFEQAINQQADGIELDIQFHQASQNFIVLHDNYLDKVTSTSGEISDFSLAELSQISLAQGQTIPTLAQAMKCINDWCLLNIEVKSAVTELQALTEQLEVLQQTIQEAISRHEIKPQQLIISSFNHVFIQQIKQRLPNIATGALIAHIPLDFAHFSQALACQYLNLDFSFINQELINDAHKRGLKVWVYTVDKPKDIKLCQDLSVDGIFTNFPLKSRQQLRLKMTV